MLGRTCDWMHRTHTQAFLCSLKCINGFITQNKAIKSGLLALVVYIQARGFLDAGEERSLSDESEAEPYNQNNITSQFIGNYLLCQKIHLRS